MAGASSSASLRRRSSSVIGRSRGQAVRHRAAGETAGPAYVPAWPRSQAPHPQAGYPAYGVLLITRNRPAVSPGMSSARVRPRWLGAPRITGWPDRVDRQDRRRQTLRIALTTAIPADVARPG